MILSPFGVVLAFGAGVVSFLSPCVFPLLPGYLAYLAGISAHHEQGHRGARWPLFPHALCFVLGLILVFVLLGIAASSIGVLFSFSQLWLARIAGGLLILFGLLLTGFIPLPIFLREYRVHLGTGVPGLLRSTLMGMTFAAGWSPCMGPMLASILALTVVSATVVQGVLFLLVYALGLGLPFLLVGLLLDRMHPLVRALQHRGRLLSLLGRILLVILGMLMLTGRLVILSDYAPVFSL